MPETKHKTSKTAKTANTDNVLAPPPVELRSKVTSMTTMARVKLGLWCQSVRAAASLSRGALGRHSPSWRTVSVICTILMICKFYRKCDVCFCKITTAAFYNLFEHGIDEAIVENTTVKVVLLSTDFSSHL